MIKTIEYYSNKSIIRFLSHLVLSLKFSIYVLLNHKHFDRVYITIPFGLTALVSSLVCRRKLIVDIVDYWPNSLPFSQKIKQILFPLFYVWEKLNYLAVERASKSISLSSTFLREAGASGVGKQVLLGATDKSELIKHNESNKLRILYTGNVGTLYDFETLISAITISNINVKLDIVGDGDRADWLTKSLADSGIEYRFHGLIYDESHLACIINDIDIGFNGFVETTASLSYKSVMYMSYGLPIINSMKGDLWDFVDKHRLGFNYLAGDISALADCLAKANKLKSRELTKSVVSFFRQNLAIEVVSKQVIEVFNNEESF